MLELASVNAHYGDFHVLHDVTFSVAKGEFVAVVGANGHGKSTLLKTICGLIPASSGDVLFEGSEVGRRSAPDLVGRGLVYVAEDRRLFPDMTVRENLMLGAFLPDPRKHARESLEFVFDLYPRLAERQAQLVGTMSGGEAQMVALGRGLMSRPTLLAIDEPSLGLAPNLTEDMLGTIASLNRNGLTILLVEQSLSLIESMVDRSLQIEEGEIVEHASTVEEATI